MYRASYGDTGGTAVNTSLPKIMPQRVCSTASPSAPPGMTYILSEKGFCAARASSSPSSYRSSRRVAAESPFQGQESIMGATGCSEATRASVIQASTFLRPDSGSFTMRGVSQSYRRAARSWA